MKNVRYKEFLVGAFLAAVLAYPWSSLLKVDPYTDVRVISAVSTEDGVIVTANFVKNACTFKRLEVFGTDLGQTYNLDWANVDTDPESDHGTSYDRAKGNQTLRILIKTKGAPFDTFEMRTRHSCDGTDVDRIFVEVKAP
jgi:hypothetical protein